VIKIDRFETYWDYVRQCVKGVTSELSLGNTDSIEVLHQHIERFAEILCSVDAFELINNQSPYEWKDLLTREMLGKNEFDLGIIVLKLANMVVFRDSLEMLIKMDSYHFLKGFQNKFTLTIPDGSRVIFKEIWKSAASGLDYLPPIAVEEVEGRELTFYREGETLFHKLSHLDPALVWVSEKVIPKPQKSVDEYERMKVKILKKYGFPKNLLWLTEVQTIPKFNQYYKSLTSPVLPETYYGVEEYHFIIYHHENGEIHCHAGFNSDEEFEKGCQFLSDHMS